MYINEERVKEIIEKTAYTRTSGSNKELECALYIKSICNELGLDAVLEEFPVRTYKEKKASLTVDGRRVLCKSWHGTGSEKVGGELYFLEGDDEVSLSGCKDKIVLCVKTFKDFYNTLYRYGAKAIITYSGNFHHAYKDVDLKIFDSVKDENNNLPCVNINVKDAFNIIKSGCRYAEIDVLIKQSTGKSHNLYLDIKGKSEKSVVVSAHYDSTRLSKGSYDNMSSCVALLYLADYFKNTKPLHTLRLLWCGSEEAGLVGSRAYCKYHADDLKNTILNI
ncbi:MAG: M28 family peptidase, partial [Clostridia bacterium]|nr:M28 family peptidase [Clostridia bacterium]